MKDNKNISIGIIVLIIILILVIAVFFMARPEENFIQGEVEATQINVSSKIPGRIEEIKVREGDKVQEGQLLATLTTPELDARLLQAESVKAAATAQDKKAQRGTRSEQLQAAYNIWQQAKAAAELAAKTYARMQNLYNDKVIPAQKRDEAYTQMKALKEQENATYSNYQMAVNGAREEDKEAASAMVMQAQGAINEVSAYKKEANIISPATAEVLKIIPNKGEIINSGFPVINLVDLNDVWVVFNITENKLGKFKKGMVFSGKVPGLDNQIIKFQVRNIAVQGNFATWSATKSRGDFDMKTFEVKAYPVDKVKGLRPGMSVLVDEQILK